MLVNLRQFLFRPVDIASLVFFRIAFGLIMMIEVWRYFDHGWIDRYYIDPDFHFKYAGFEWITPWAGDGMYWHFALLGVLAACIMTGAFYRIATVLFFFAFSYVFLLDQTQYLNHFYLVIIVSFLLCFVPAHRSLSVDAQLWPKLRSRTIPAWAVWLLVAQFEIMFLYAGFVKINPDWLQLEPLGTWLARRSDQIVFGFLFNKPWAVAIGAYGIIFLHLFGAPLLLWRRTRLTVFWIYAAFHLTNHFVFQIGIFPWLTLAATLMFLDPDWPRQLARRLLRPLARLADMPPPEISLQPERVPESDVATPVGRPARIRQSVIMAAIASWIVFQIGMPLRHFSLPGDVAWNEDGHRFSWRMKLRSKRGEAEFVVWDPGEEVEYVIDPRDYLTRRQVGKMITRPDMILQFAHYLGEIYGSEKGVTSPAVRADIQVSLNYRPPAQFTDPEMDLTQIKRSDRNATWIVPLATPLPKTRAWAEP